VILIHFTLKRARLKTRGFLQGVDTKVFGHVLGNILADGEDDSRKEWSDSVVIKPWLYSDFISQGEKRMFQLREKLANAPFLQEFAATNPLENTKEDTDQLELMDQSNIVNMPTNKQKLQ
uniref:hypothetical protein n=1 Tax=uncultured Roseibium sp. TaxID=1936171 RepID=UPI002618E9E9